MLDVEITAKPLMGIYLLSYNVDCTNNQNSINNTSTLWKTVNYYTC